MKTDVFNMIAEATKPQNLDVLTVPEKKQCVLIKKETYKIPLEDQKEIEVFKGSQIECLGKFHRLSGFSFEKNNTYSYTQYYIREC